MNIDKRKIGGVDGVDTLCVLSLKNNKPRHAVGEIRQDSKVTRLLVVL